MLRVSKIENFKTKNVKNFQKKTLIFGTIRPNSFFLDYLTFQNSALSTWNYAETYWRFEKKIQNVW